MEDGQIGYRLLLTSPKDLTITANVGLERIGNIGIPIKFEVPSSPLVQGKSFGVFKSDGKLRVGMTGYEYKIVLGKLVLKPDASGIDLRAKGTLAIARLPAAAEGRK